MKLAKKISMRKIFLISLILTLTSTITYSQGDSGDNISGSNLANKVNPLSPAVPFLDIPPDTRAGGMGNVGVATRPDLNSQHWNAAKYPFAEPIAGASISVTPWLRHIIDDIYLAYLTGYYRLDGMQSLSTSLRYFDLGEILFTDEAGANVSNFNPKEVAFDVAYSRKFSEKLAAALTFRYIFSDLTGGIDVSRTDNTTKSGHAIAMDMGVYYESGEIEYSKMQYALGAVMSNIGSKISYSDSNSKDSFIPMNLRLGGRVDYIIDDYNEVSFSMDFNKLMIPTPPVRETTKDLNGDGDKDDVIEGKEDDVPVITGLFQSFYDAPGGFEEELHEWTVSAGVEYLYANTSAIRAGYFWEHETKGNRKYFTVGYGLKFRNMNLDVSYLISLKYNNPMANTIRFSLGYNINDMF